MRLTVPANYDSALLPRLREHGVFEVYGKLPSDVVGGGRPTYMSTPIGKRELSRYLDAAHGAGLEFNYLLNAACLGNREWTRSFHTKLGRLLDWLAEIQVDSVTVVAPYLLQIVKRRYPRLKVKVGIYAQVDTVKRAVFWEDLGADAINLESFSINRDLDKLARIRAAVRCDLPLIANHFCQPNCPYQIQHQNGHAHASEERHRFLIDYPLLQCHKRRLGDPALFISAGWIRPEDVHHYEALGYQTFKLLERNIPSDALLERVKAYAARRFDGNLAELLLSWGFKRHPPRFSWHHFLRTFGPWRVSPTRYGLIRRFLQAQGMFFTRVSDVPPIVIDSSRIPEAFFEHFRNGSCSDRTCATCGYCSRVASQAVRVDPAFLEEVMPLYRSLESLLVDGEMWRVFGRSASEHAPR